MNSKWTLQFVSLAAALVLMSAAGAGSQASAATSAKPAYATTQKGTAVAVPSRGKTGSGAIVVFKPSALNSANLAVDLPSGVTLVARQTHVSKSGDATSWTGSIVGSSNDRLALTSRNGAVAGSMTYQGTSYIIAPRGAGTSLLYALDPLKMLKIDEGGRRVEKTPPVIAREKDSLVARYIATPPSGPSVTDVVIFYTDLAMQRAGGQQAIEASIVSEINVSNTIYRESLVNNTLRIVGMELVALIEGPTFNDTIDHFRVSEQQMATRERLNGDISILISGGAHGCGIAYVYTPGPGGWYYRDNTAQGVVDFGCMGTMVLAHEVGHMTGLNHERNPGYNVEPGYNWGYKYCDGATAEDRFADVMSYACTNGQYTQLYQFSSPDLTYRGLATGVIYETNPTRGADAARWLREYAPEVAAFRTPQSVLTVPTTPTNASGSSSVVGTIDLSWTDASDNETGFAVYRSVGGDFVEIASLPGGVDSFSDNTVDEGRVYSYLVRALNSAGYSGDSNIATVTAKSTPSPIPSAPTNLKASSPAPGIVNLTWTDTSGNETAFVLERAANGVFIEVARLGPNTVSMQQTGVPEGQTYQYRLFAINSAGASPISNVLSVIVASTPVTPSPVVTPPLEVTAPPVATPPPATAIARSGGGGGAGDWVAFVMLALLGGLGRRPFRTFAVDSIGKN